MSFMVVERQVYRTDPEDLHGQNGATCMCGECPAAEVAVLRMHGFSHPTIFRTLRNAAKAAKHSSWGGARSGYVVKFDPSLLPIVEETYQVDSPLHPPERAVLKGIPTWETDPDDAITLEAEFVLAERQMLLWSERARMLQAKMQTQSPTPDGGSDKRRRTKTTTLPSE